jgi:hypothetical protein
MRRVLAPALLLAGTAAGVAHAAPNPLTVKTDGEAVVVEVNDSQGAAFGVGVYKDGSAACYGQRYSKPTCVALLP